jgi:hypothetical protein
MKISVSPGNSKTGKIPSISLPPGVSCTACARRTCFLEGCYAVNLARYPAVRAAWARNWEVYRTDPSDFFAQIDAYLTAKRPKYFRWHISGDIPTAQYFAEMLALALDHPNTKFLVFTKTAHRSDVPNLRLVSSRWPGDKDPKGNPPAAWMRDAKHPDPRIPHDARECPGNCETCGACWALRDGEAVVFDKH